MRLLTGRPKLSFSDLIALASAAALIIVELLLHASGPSAQKRRLLLAFAITVGFALAAWLARGVNGSGALAGSAIAFVMAARDVRLFWVLLLVFAVTLAATRAGKSRKQELKTEEAPRGRSAAQVMANLGFAGLITVAAPETWPILVLAALAEAAADTCSSEVGMAYPGKTVLLTSWKPVEPGVDGGVSLRGTLAAVIAAIMISAAAVALKLVPVRFALPIIYAGVLGSLVDSLIGALLERRGMLSNDVVNLLSTAAAVGIMWVMI
jgi:uncharacterized protein (TIGR00297 family)